MRKLLIPMVFAILLCLPMFISQPVKASVANSWKTLAPMPTPRSNFEVAVVNDKVYAIGGFRAYANRTTIDLSVNEEYDPATNIWAEKAPMPIASDGFAMAAYQNKIYIFEPGLPTYVYDAVTDTWTNKTSVPIPSVGLRANVVDDKIYLIGGFAGRSVPSNYNQVYVPSNDTWQSAVPIPYGASDYASAVVDNKIYITAGVTATMPSDSSLNQIYDVTTNTWTSGAPFPIGFPLDASAVATTGTFAPERIYVIFGQNNVSYVAQLNEIYNPADKTWSSGEPDPISRTNSAVAVVNDQLYVIGGEYDNYTATGVIITTFASNERYTPVGYVQPTPSPKVPEITPVAVFSLAVAVCVVVVAFKKRVFRTAKKKV